MDLLKFGFPGHVVVKSVSCSREQQRLILTRSLCHHVRFLDVTRLCNSTSFSKQICSYLKESHCFTTNLAFDPRVEQWSKISFKGLLGYLYLHPCENRMIFGVCSKVWVLSPIGISNQHVSESIWSMFSPCILGNLKLPRTFHERSEQLPRPCWMNAPQGAGGVLLRSQEGDMVINAIPHNSTSKQVNAKHFLSCILATG